MPHPINHAFLSHTATLYPFAKEDGSFLFVDGGVYPYVDTSGGLTQGAVVTIPGEHQRTAREVLAYFDHEPERMPRTPVVAYGANANVGVLTRKFVTNPAHAGSGVVPVTQLILRDLDVVWAAHFGRHGSIPATIESSPGTEISVWVTWLDQQQLLQMHDSETITDYYSYGTLERRYVVASDVELVQDLMVYVDCYGALTNGDHQILAVMDIPAKGRIFPETSAIGAISSICGTVEWNGSPYELILDNLKDGDAARARILQLRSRAVFNSIDGYDAVIACAR